MKESSHRESVDNIHVHFSPDNTPPTVHQTLSDFEREHKVKPFENKCVSETVRACLQQLWPDFLLAGFIAYRQTARPQQSQLTALICFDRGGLSTALDTHLQQEP